LIPQTGNSFSGKLNGKLSSRSMLLVFGLATFLSAFLLFQIQPLISKMILPWFGGTPNVWTTCILFFQSLLFFGYLYAHLLVTLVTPRAQGLIHILLLLAACILVQIIPESSLKPGGTDNPVTAILLILGSCVGVPYFVLSTNGPLLQAWFAQSFPGRSPYRLYALSNLGSLVALLSYPFFFEPWLGASQQAGFWTVGFFIAALFIAIAALSTWHPARAAPAEHSAQALGTWRSDAVTTPAEALPWSRWLPWFLLPMIASTALLSTTNQVCQDVAAVPFLWVVPLSLYLISFILCFEHPRWYWRPGYGLAGMLAAPLVAATLVFTDAFTISAQVLVCFAGLFITCMLCHGELARLKPEPQRLTLFYLTLAAGGACGGLLVSVAAPLVFPFFLEFHLTILVSTVIATWVFLQEMLKRYPGLKMPFAVKLCLSGALLSVVVFLPLLPLHVHAIIKDSEGITRNFYGVIRITHRTNEAGGGRIRAMLHGRVVHGSQFDDDQASLTPTTYYGRTSAIGNVIEALRSEYQTLRIGVVGLGVGTLAAHGSAVDHFRFYEINEAVIRVARDNFRYLSNSKSTADVIVGDARLSMERENAQNYALLVIDAFSGDSIPTHLLSVEAMQVYLDHLQANGVLAIHISNNHLDLRPVVSALAENAGLDFIILERGASPQTGENKSVWLLASEDSSLLAKSHGELTVPSITDKRILWSDNFSNLLTLLK
jgi:hypothetical protein